MTYFMAISCIFVFSLCFVILDKNKDKGQAIVILFISFLVYCFGYIDGYINKDDTIKQTMLNDKPYSFKYESDDDGNEYMMFIKLDHITKINNTVAN